MKKYLEFYKEKGIWYADIPENTPEENEMLLGADEFLEELFKDCKKVAMDLNTEEPEKYLVKMKLIMHDEIGGEYVLSGPLIDVAEKNRTQVPLTAWICNATHTVFGEHPDLIFIENIYKFVPVILETEPGDTE